MKTLPRIERYDEPKCLLFVTARMHWEDVQPVCDDWCSYYQGRIIEAAAAAGGAGARSWAWRWTAHCYPTVMTSLVELAWVQAKLDELDMLYTWVGALTAPADVLVDDDGDGFTQWEDFLHVPRGL